MAGHHRQATGQRPYTDVRNDREMVAGLAAKRKGNGMLFLYKIIQTLA